MVKTVHEVWKILVCFKKKRSCQDSESSGSTGFLAVLCPWGPSPSLPSPAALARMTATRLTGLGQGDKCKIF